MVDDLYIIDCGKYLTIANGKGKEENHSHISKGNKKKQYEAAKCLINLVETKRIPKSNYFKDSALRLTLDKKYKKRIQEDKKNCAKV